MATGVFPDRRRSTWWAIGGLLVLMVGYILYSFVGTVVFGVFIYYATRPLYRRLRGRLRSDSLAAAVALNAMALPVLVLLAYTVAIALQEANRFVRSTELGPYGAMLRPYLDISTMVTDPATLVAEADVALVRQTLEGTLASVGFVGGLLLHLFVMFAIAFYLLRDGHRLARWFREHFSEDQEVLDACLAAIDDDFNAIFFGTILNAILAAAIGALTYSLLAVIAPPGAGVPYPALIGFLAGVASLVPVVGMKLVYVPVAGYLAVSGFGTGTLWFAGVFFAVSLVIVDAIPDLVIRPYVSGRNLHVGLVMLAYIFGPLLFGWYGIFLGPIVLVMVAHFAYYVMPPLLSGDPV